MRFHGVIKVNEANKFLLPVNAGFELGLRNPHFENGSDDPFGLAIGAWRLGSCERLADTMRPAELHKSMFLWIPFILRSIVSIPSFYAVWTLIQNLREKCCRGVLALIRQNRGIELAGKVINRHIERFRLLCKLLSLEHGKLRIVRMEHFSWILLVVSQRLSLQTFLEFGFNLRQAFQTVFKAAVTLIDALMDGKIALSSAINDIVNRMSAYPILAGEGGDSNVFVKVPISDFSPLDGRKPRRFMNSHIVHSIPVGKCEQRD